MAQKALTERSVRALTTTKRRGEDVYDARLKGFGVTVHPSGRKSFWLVYADPRGARTDTGRPARRRLHLGKYPVVSVADARADALAALGEVRRGHDPAEEKERRRAMPSFQEWVTEYLAGVRLRKKQPRDDVAYLGMACERWGNKPLDTILADDIAKLVQSYGEKHRPAANRLLASVGACLQAAWRMDLILANPARRVQRFPENPPRDRTLTDDELHRVLKALAAWPDLHERAAFALLLATGARLSEVLRARWSDLDLDAGTWRLPSPKSGHPQLVPLNGDTVAMLRRLPRPGDFVIPGRSTPDKPRYDLKTAWDAIKAAAKCPDVRVHDLRRTFGLAVARAAGLHVASKMLRHGDVGITGRIYAPLGFEDLRKAAEQQGSHLKKVSRMRPRKRLAS